MTLYHSYLITNTIDDLIYVGCTEQSLKERLRSHRTHSYTSNSVFYRHMKMIGITRFDIHLIESRICMTSPESRVFEQEIIQQYKPQLNTYKAHIIETVATKRHKEQCRQWRQRHPSVDCPCGGRFCRMNRKRHERTKRHMWWLNHYTH